MTPGRAPQQGPLHLQRPEPTASFEPPGRPLPSLTHRVAATVVLAFAVVFVLLFAWIWGEAMSRETGEIDRSLLQSAKGMAATLDELDSPTAARTAVALFRTTQPLQDPPGEPPVHVAAARLDGTDLQAEGALTALPLAALPGGLSVQRLNGQELRVYLARGQRWQVAIVDDDTQRGRWMGLTLAKDLLLYLSLALPVVLLPVWWMVRRLLAPLADLSATVAARAVHDTRPLPPARQRWRELVPLEQALNRLFERTGASLAREKAFVHDAAHELRTPLAVIATQAHVLASAEPAARAAAAERLHAAVTRSSHLTQRLLELAQAESAARAPPAAVDLMDLARDAMALLADRAVGQGTVLELNGPDRVPLQADARALRSVLDNLLDNALRYGGAGGAVAVTVAVDPAARQIELRVADSGPGIATPERERVFERFWRGATGHGQPGTGLGLAIVHEAALALGGGVQLAPSAPGATFVVTLPLHAPIEAA